MTRPDQDAAAAAEVRPRLVLATRNEHKVRELADILAGVLRRIDRELVGVSAFPDLAEVVESGVTFAENALLKARAVVAATGLPAIADDSGLAVEVLGGSPGVFSARWSGRGGTREERDRANNALLLAQLADVPEQHRGAGFVCAAALVLPDGTEVVREGTVRGRLGREPAGEEGFGYDPLLRLPDGRTLAQLSPAEKHEISHRGEAFRALGRDLERLLAP